MDLITQALNLGLAPAIVVAIYLTIVRYLDTKKEIKTVKMSASIVSSITTISNFLEDITKNIIDKDTEKCKNAIEDSIYSMAHILSHFIAETVINNHIDINKDLIISNISNIVNSSYYNVYSRLSIYKCNNIVVSTYMKQEWIKEIEEDMKNILYNNALGNDEKILAFANRIKLRTQGYIMYLINKSTNI